MESNDSGQTPNQQSDIDIQQINKAITLLSDHFDTVQIFVTRSEGDVTHHLQSGVGNWFARYGHVIDWLRSQDRQ